MYESISPASVAEASQGMAPQRSRRSSMDQARPSHTAVYLVMVLLLLVNLTTGITNIPLNRLLERRLCRQFYSSDNEIDEDLCKIDQVQKTLAWIMGGFDTLWTVGDSVTTIPLTFVSERFGRKFALWLNIVPRFFMLCWILSVSYFENSLPPRAAIAGAALSVLGGDTVFNSLVYSLASSLADDDVVRAVYFSRMQALTSVLGFLSPAIASATMTVRLTLPFWLGLLLLMLASVTISCLPATDTRMDDLNDAGRPLISSPTLKAQVTRESLITSISNRLHELISCVGTVQLALLLLSMFLTSLASSDTKLLAQYISKRYHWTFAAAGYLLSAKAGVNFIVLSIIIPFLLSKRGRTSQNMSDKAHLRYARFCVIASAFGAFAIGVSASVWVLFPSLLIYAIGVPLSIFTLSLANSPNLWLRDQSLEAGTANPRTHIFSIVMMTKTLGSLIGQPFMAALWYYGIDVRAYGSPYLASSVVYLLALSVMSRIQLI
ncbi:major facilitator superfamily domain-containing protein [Xylariaceae sp. FL1019]|nr:major facilitator superfamily domain-containing protein [Xylariaceae sp. FL1019]